MIKYDLGTRLNLDDKYDDKLMNAFGALLREKEQGVSGYYKLPENSLHLIDEAKNYLESQFEFLKDIKNIVVVGIGGSSLGTKAIDSLLRHKYDNLRNLYFLENPDPVDILTNLNKVEKENTIFVIISKSGTTIETTSIFKLIIDRFDLDFTTIDNKRVMIITDESSPLCKFADLNNIKACTIPSNVGGRFSVLSAVGLVPLILTGYDVKPLLEGASSMIQSFFDMKEKHILQKACFCAENAKKYPINVLFSYSNTLNDFTKWYIQLWAESLGKINKEGENVGLTPVGQIGAIDQHSFLQLIVEGPKNKTVTFIKIKDFEINLNVPDISLKFIEKTNYINGHSFNELLNAEADATIQTLVERDVPVDVIELDRITEENIGNLIAYFELLTSATGDLLGVNTYNQPGVEFGKKILEGKFK
jgi:glucose-6-phosphate isomerase